MDKLTKMHTGQIFSGEGAYMALERHWSSLVNSPVKSALGPEHHLLYQALRGKDWRKGFAPITNRRKLENGAFYNWGLQHALRRVHSEWAEEKLLQPFADVVDLEMLQKLRAMLPKSVDGFDIVQAYEVTDYDR